MVEKDDPEGLAKAIDRVIRDDKLQKKLSKAGLETAKKYTWDNVVSQLENYYKELSRQKKKSYIKKAIK